jgi:hypothetical protein
VAPRRACSPIARCSATSTRAPVCGLALCTSDAHSEQIPGWGSLPARKRWVVRPALGSDFESQRLDPLDRDLPHAAGLLRARRVPLPTRGWTLNQSNGLLASKTYSRAAEKVLLGNSLLDVSTFPRTLPAM